MIFMCAYVDIRKFMNVHIISSEVHTPMAQHFDLLEKFNKKERERDTEMSENTEYGCFKLPIFKL